MSDFLNPDDEPEDHSRRRALWGLVVLACVALIVGSLMVLLGGGSGDKRDSATLDGPVNANPTTTPAPTSGRSDTPSATRTTSTSSTPTRTRPTTTTPAAHPRSGNPCPGASSCRVDGDGDLTARVNVYRAKHGQQPVPGKVSTQAQTCALNKGNGSACSPHWIVTIDDSQDGAQALSKMADFNSAWLLDSKMKSFSVGWAYVGGSYQCVILKVLTTD